MTNLRAFQSGAIVWGLIFSSFIGMSFLPGIKDSKDLQNGLILILIIPFVIFGNWFFYKKENKLNSFYLALTIILSSLFLDGIITLPLIIIPEGGSYFEFYTDPGLVIMSLEILTISYLYWRIKIKPNII